MNGGSEEGVYKTPLADGRIRYTLFSCGKTVKTASQIIAVSDNEKRIINIREVMMGDGAKRTFTIGIPEDAETFILDNDGNITKASLEDEVSIDDVKGNKALMVRRGESGYASTELNGDVSNYYIENVDCVYLQGENVATEYVDGNHVIIDGFYRLDSISSANLKEYVGVKREDGKIVAEERSITPISSNLAMFTTTQMNNSGVILCSMDDQKRFVKVVDKDEYIDTTLVNDQYTQGRDTEHIPCENGYMYPVSSANVKVSFMTPTNMYLSKPDETTSEIDETWIYSDFMTPNDTNFGKVLLFFPEPSKTQPRRAVFTYNGKNYSFNDGVIRPDATHTVAIWFNYAI